ncbi:cytochrome P450 [Amylostereum chailletii]|nr:cytochrome P450 [Amylostereum chailletii]
MYYPVLEGTRHALLPGNFKVGIWPRSTVSIVLADPAAIKEVTTHRARFPKPVSNYRVLTFFGKNIIASEGEEWKRYRKIAAPAFSEKNNKLVWDETIRIMLDLFDNVWHRAPEVSYDHCIEITLPFYVTVRRLLFSRGTAGFGRRISWTDDLKVPEGHLLTFKDALHIVSTDTLLKIVVPNWAMGLTERTRKCRLAFEELDRYMMEMIQGRRSAEKKEERYDLFSSLLDAADGEEESKLSDRELVGNIFIFLVAGHETTAHTLCFCFAYLALYPEEQERLYRQIKDVIKDAGRLPTYEEMGSLTYSMAVFYETLRLRPPVAGVPKVSAEDTSLAISNSRGEKMTLPIPCGTRLILNIAGLQHNPRCWDDPDAFKPERFLGEWPKDAFLPFSGGARACIGRRFFETEGIAILTMLVSQYSVEIKDEPQFAQESFEERHARVLRSTQGLSTTPVRVPVTFKRRT